MLFKKQGTTGVVGGDLKTFCIDNSAIEVSPINRTRYKNS